MIPFDTHSRATLKPLSILKKKSSFFLKKPIYFSKKSQILNVLRILTIPVAFYSKFPTIWSKKNSRSVAWTNLPMWRERNWQAWGKKTSEIAHLRRRFCFHILYIAQSKQTDFSLLLMSHLIDYHADYTYLNLDPPADFDHGCITRHNN